MCPNHLTLSFKFLQCWLLPGLVLDFILFREAYFALFILLFYTQLFISLITGPEHTHCACLPMEYDLGGWLHTVL